MDYDTFNGEVKKDLVVVIMGGLQEGTIEAEDAQKISNIFLNTPTKNGAEILALLHAIAKDYPVMKPLYDKYIQLATSYLIEQQKAQQKPS